MRESFANDDQTDRFVEAPAQHKNDSESDIAQRACGFYQKLHRPQALVQPQFGHRAAVSSRIERSYSILSSPLFNLHFLRTVIASTPKYGAYCFRYSSQVLSQRCLFLQATL